MQDQADDLSAKKNELLKEDFETLRKDASKLKEDLTIITSRLMEAGKEKSGVAGQAMEEQGNKLLEELEQIIRESRSKHKDKIESISKKVEEKPFLSLFIAFLAGLFISRLFGRD